MIAWYKRYPDAALAGMMELTLEERGAYNTVLDLIYSRAGDLPDDDRFIAGWCRVDVRIWRRIKARLVAVGKLWITDGVIHNAKADVVVLEALGRGLSARYAGTQSGRIRRRKSDPQSNKNNGVGRTGVATERERMLERNRDRDRNPFIPFEETKNQGAEELSLETVAWRVKKGWMPMPPLDRIRDALAAGLIDEDQARACGAI